jgi:spore germination cell wall hydrolase CwlJ-like protein
MGTFLKKVGVFVLICLMAMSNQTYAQDKKQTNISYKDLISSNDGSKADLYWLTMNIYYEAGKEPLIGKIAVGIVTLNRLKDNRFPKTIQAVVTEPQQFSWYNGGNVKSPPNVALWKECYDVAKMLLTKSKDTAIISLLEGATHFHATYVKPDWARHAVKVVQIGDHVFYRTKHYENRKERI